MRIKAMTEGPNSPEPVEGEAAPAVGPGTGAEPGAQDLLPQGETEGLFEVANLFPRTTGLPMTVWVSPRGNARHDLRVKVDMTYGNQPFRMPRSSLFAPQFSSDPMSLSLNC